VCLHIREGNDGDVRLDGFNLIALGTFEGNIWAGEAKVTMGLFIDESADEGQREASQLILGGQAGGWPADFAANIGETRGIEFVPIAFEVAGYLASRVELPGRVVGRAEALTGPICNDQRAPKGLLSRDRRGMLGKNLCRV
jgi:hypothetical protein